VAAIFIARDFTLEENFTLEEIQGAASTFELARRVLRS
jgi:hypothetical protein